MEKRGKNEQKGKELKEGEGNANQKGLSHSYNFISSFSVEIRREIFKYQIESADSECLALFKSVEHNTTERHLALTTKNESLNHE